RRWPMPVTTPGPWTSAASPRSSSRAWQIPMRAPWPTPRRRSRLTATRSTGQSRTCSAATGSSTATSTTSRPAALSMTPRPACWRPETRRDEAQRLDRAIAQQQRRDLVIELEWSAGTPCDLDLSVFEPINTTCSATQRQTPAGSMLVCDDIATHKETYTVAEAFSGTYLVRVNRVWGRPLNGNATLKVTRHQGTEDQVIEYHTVSVDQSAEIKVSLANGRR